MEKIGVFFGKIFNRTFLNIALICIQFGWLAFVVMKLSNYAEWISIAFTVFAIIMALFISYRDFNPAYKMSWIILICLVPVIGGLGYALYGNKRPSKRLIKRIDPVERRHRHDLKQEYGMNEVSDGRIMRTSEYITEFGPYPAWSETKTYYYNTAKRAVDDIIEELEKAEHYIFIEYFIIGTGEVWDRIHQILKEKAEQGVDVRIIYDSVGSISRLPVGFKKNLEKEGIRVLVFNPLIPVASLIYNNRDHRKIMVIDGYIAYTGGFNIADEYVMETKQYGEWKDAGLRLEGKAVWNFTVMFLNMWNAFEHSEEDYTSYRPEIHSKKKVFDSDGIVQPYSDSPLDHESLGENVYLEMINQAKDYIYIFTPYLVPGNEMITSLELAAKRGVDVRIVTPGVPDKFFVYRLTGSYFPNLVKNGVKIYRYKPGFMHSKCMLSDDTKGIVGTINIDYRSLFLHFECGVFMLGCRALNSLKDDFNNSFENSEKVELEDCTPGFFGKLFDGILKALSPWF